MAGQGGRFGNGKGGRWGQYEYASLRKLVAEYGTNNWSRIVARMGGRSLDACKQQWILINLTEAERKARRERESAERIERAGKSKREYKGRLNTREILALAAAHQADIAARLAEAMARPQHAPDNVTAITMGDPTPGRSALDALRGLSVVPRPQVGVSLK